MNITCESEYVSVVAIYEIIMIRSKVAAIHTDDTNSNLDKKLHGRFILFALSYELL